MRILFSFTNLLLMKRAVAPQSTIAATDALRFRPLRAIQILKWELSGFNSGITQESILLQGFEFTILRPFSEAQAFSGDVTAACVSARIKNSLRARPLSGRPGLFVVPPVGLA
jgi:hypothetical protein